MRHADLLTPLLDADGMGAADYAAMNDWALPGRVLMEIAGRACADAVQHLLIKHSLSTAEAHVTVLAGKGNNGGDGLVTGRVLADRGLQVTVLTLENRDTDNDRGANLRLLRHLAETTDRLRILTDPEALYEAPPDLIVDAMLGIGATGALRDPIRTLAAWANQAGAPVLAVDVPSGLDATTGTASEQTVRAEHTLTMAAVKTGLVMNEGPDHAGTVSAVEIGIPRRVIREHACAFRSTDAWAHAVLPRRTTEAHKYSTGRVAAVVGSYRFTGAAVLATGAAARVGAGAVTACTPVSARATLDAHYAEVMVDAQPETSAGTLAHAALDAASEHLASADAAVIGCGLGRHPETQRLICDLLPRLDGVPAVLDADGLNAVADAPDPGAVLRGAAGPLLLTPHLGELRRLLNDPHVTLTNGLHTVSELARRWNAVLLLKGMPSVVGTPEGDVFVGPPGEPGLATAGTGDVLAGLAGGLLAQGLPATEAALCALHLGGAAAARYRAATTDDGRRRETMRASDLLHQLPFLFA